MKRIWALALFLTIVVIVSPLIAAYVPRENFATTACDANTGDAKADSIGGDFGLYCKGCSFTQDRTGSKPYPMNVSCACRDPGNSKNCFATVKGTVSMGPLFINKDGQGFKLGSAVDNTIQRNP